MFSTYFCLFSIIHFNVYATHLLNPLLNLTILGHDLFHLVRQQIVLTSDQPEAFLAFPHILQAALIG